jgi:hypothetical protein
MLDEIAGCKFLEYDKGLRSFVGHMSEESLASHALVVMIRGLTTDWKPVVAYCLTGDSVHGSVLWNLVTRIIVQLNACEVNVCAVVCDMVSCNRAMWRVGGIAASQNYVVNSVKRPVLSDQQLYFLPDVPHVLKNVHIVCYCKILFCHMMLWSDSTFLDQLFQFFICEACLTCRKLLSLR